MNKNKPFSLKALQIFSTALPTALSARAAGGAPLRDLLGQWRRAQRPHRPGRRCHGPYAASWRASRLALRAHRATDIDRIAGGQIADNRHIEDKPALMQQFGFAAK